MKTQHLLIAALIALLTSNQAAGWSVAAAPTANNGSNNKMRVLDSYLQRCVAVLSSKGYSPAAIKTECKCELDQIDQHFNIFQQMLAGGTADNQQQINDFKNQLLQCKVKPD